jgi:ABC-type Fe3+-hydroxamate transport system substrate-binding protein
MPSSYTPLGFEQQAAGEGTNVWGAPKLNNALGRIDSAIGGYYAVAITGSTSLTTSNSSTADADNTGRRALLKFTGSLAANATITVPSVGFSRLIWNATNKVLTITTGAGNTVTIDAGDKTVVWCDGSDCHTIYFGGYDLKAYITAQTASAGAVPGTVGQLGKFLKVTVDGSAPTWQQVSTTDLSDYQTAILGIQVALAVAL